MRMRTRTPPFAIDPTGLPETSKLVTMVLKILSKMTGFLLICFLAIAMFANAFLLLFVTAAPAAFEARAQTRRGDLVGAYFSFGDAANTVFRMMLVHSTLGAVIA